MADATLDLARLLDPIERPEFFESYWEKRPLHLGRSDAHYYNDLLTLSDLERLIASPEARYPAIQLSKGGVYFPPEVYCDDWKFGTQNFSGVPDVQKIAAEYRAGASIVLPALHRTWTPLKELCARMENELDHVVHANAYLTPGNTAGFSPHYDTHEVLVLQIAGRKLWRIYAPPVELPHRKQPFTPVGYKLPEKPLLEIELSPGDLLYLPRGYIHTTTTSETHSAHTTLGIAIYTWLDLAGELLQSAMGSARLRQALPPGFASRGDAKPALVKELNEVLDQLLDGADSDEIIDLFLNRVRSNKMLERGAFRADVSVIEPDTLLQSPDPEHYRIVSLDAKVAVEFQQRRFILPGDARATLEGMRQQRVFKAADLPGTLSIDAKLALVRTLVEKGFLSRRSHDRDGPCAGANPSERRKDRSPW
jgi:lysine-specific demethylase/histidyl-hydroxylase NO66